MVVFTVSHHNTRVSSLESSLDIGRKVVVLIPRRVQFAPWASGKHCVEVIQLFFRASLLPLPVLLLMLLSPLPLLATAVSVTRVDDDEWHCMFVLPDS